jgi:rhamnosyltransferase
MQPFIVMRSHNDMPIIAETLRHLHRQNRPFELLALDNASSDGTVEELKKYTDRIINIPAGQYVPGRVLNLGMESSTGELVVFLNSDCTPRNEYWLEELLAGFDNDQVAAVFSRQVPRPDCQPIFAKDTDDTYGDGARQKYWRHCFSMASSAIRRSVWARRPFNEKIQYSEDIEWTWWARRQGFTIRYAPQSIVAHSHNYTLRQFYRRHFGEGKADAAIFDWSWWESSLLRYSLMPYGRQLVSDVKYCIGRGFYRDALYSPVLRMAQLLGRRKGLRAGLLEKKS